jgi:ribosomal protein S18 acetylase RimI-like enzyme
VTCLILVRPEARRQGIGGELLARSERYLRQSGAGVLYAGPIHPLNPFYLGLYGGSELPGVLDTLPEAHRFLLQRGYGEIDRTVVLERQIAGYRSPVDRNQMLIRRRTSVEVVQDPSPKSWWEACTAGAFDRTRFVLRNRDDGMKLAWSTIWMLEPLAQGWGVRAVGLTDVETAEGHQRKGHATFLLSELFKRLDEEGIGVVQVQTMQRNVAATGLYRKLGFREIDGGTVYRKKGD